MFGLNWKKKSFSNFLCHEIYWIMWHGLVSKSQQIITEQLKYCSENSEVKTDPLTHQFDWCGLLAQVDRDLVQRAVVGAVGLLLGALLQPMQQPNHNTALVNTAISYRLELVKNLFQEGLFPRWKKRQILKNILKQRQRQITNSISSLRKLSKNEIEK